MGIRQAVDYCKGEVIAFKRLNVKYLVDYTNVHMPLNW